MLLKALQDPPGPDVTKTTPTFPVDLAKPSAAWTAACSCLTKICRIFFCLKSSSYIGSTAPPG
jgi:hypothetical protein